MDVRSILTPQVLQTALLIMQKATVVGDQAYAYVQTVEALKRALIEMQRPVKEDDGGNSEAVD